MPIGLKINANNEGKWNEDVDDDEDVESEDDDNSSEDSSETEYINYGYMSPDETGETNYNMVHD
jgi:hypothetical protein